MDNSLEVRFRGFGDHDMAKGWENRDVVKVQGIPVPSGNYEVGCTHLMHQDLQIRLYYPTERDLATTFEYATYYPDLNCLKASLDLSAIPLSDFTSGELQSLLSKF